MPTKLLCGLTSAVALVLSSPVVAADGNAAARLLRTLESSSPDEARAVRVRKVEIDMGPGTLVIEQGVIVPSAPVEGQTLEIAFSGEAWFRFSTTDSVEYQQLELFTGETSLLTQVTQAVLVTGNEKAFASILAGEPAEAVAAREAAKAFKGWVSGAERRGFGADLAMLRALREEPLANGYFAVWCRSPDHGDFLYILDPAAAEPITLSQFVPLDMSGLDVWQQRYVKNFLHLYKFFGRYTKFSMENPGDWDTWVSAATRPPAAIPIGPEPEHYTLDLYVNPQINLDAVGSATIRLRAGASAAHSLSFGLYSGLKVTEVLGPKNVPLDFLRNDDQLHVFLPSPAEPGSSFSVRVAYEGDMVDGGTLLDSLGWYPRTGEIDRATYDVTLRRPASYTVLASGRTVDSGEQEGVAWERRSLDLPALGFSFQLGRFDLVREQIGHVMVTFGFVPETPGSGPDFPRDEIIATVKRCLPVFEELFGPYPLDYLTVVPVPRGYSQGILSLVTLSMRAMRDFEAKEEHLRTWNAEHRDLTIAHEISHQWWGNWVGWRSYRDQWLSEALASWSALLSETKNAENKAAFLARNARDWRSSMTQRTLEGRAVSSVGPVTLGTRLFSSKSRNAYEAIVYDKGSVVFRMLSRMFGEEAFARMLGELARSVANRTIDTETFFKAMERMSGQDLQPFTAQFVYGTGIPEVHYSYAFEPKEDGKGWVVRGEAIQHSRREESLAIIKDPDGSWKVERKAKLEGVKPVPPLLVPFQIVLTPPEKVKSTKPGEVKSARGLGGRLTLSGPRTPFSFNVLEKPERMEFDQFGEVLAFFHDSGWTPRKTLRLQAHAQMLLGDHDAAERLLGEALAAPVYSERALQWMSPERRKQLDQDEDAHLEDARIHTLRARLLAESGDLGGVEKALAAAEKLLESPESQAGAGERLALRGRLDLARGDARAAYERLRVGLHRWFFDAEGYAMLSIAAHLTGHDRIADQALERAERRGVDVRALKEARRAK